MFRDPKLIPTTPPDPDGERQRQSDDASWFSFQSELWKGVVWEVVAIAVGTRRLRPGALILAGSAEFQHWPRLGVRPSLQHGSSAILRARAGKHLEHIGNR